MSTPKQTKLFVSNFDPGARSRSKKEKDWTTNSVGPWRKVRTYVDSDGNLIRIEKRWKGVASKRSKRVTNGEYTMSFPHVWDSSSEVREVVLETGFNPNEILHSEIIELYE